MKRILIVSADREASVYLMNNLKEQDLDYCVVTSGKGCLEILEGNEIYAVLIDNSILDIKGHNLLELVNKLRPEMNLLFVNSSHEPRIESQVRQAAIVYYSTDMRDKQIVWVARKLSNNQMQANDRFK